MPVFTDALATTGAAATCCVGVLVIAVVVAAVGTSATVSVGGISTGGRSNCGGGGGGGGASLCSSVSITVWIGGASTSIALRARPVASAQAMKTCSSRIAPTTRPRRVKNPEVSSRAAICVAIAVSYPSTPGALAALSRLEHRYPHRRTRTRSPRRHAVLTPKPHCLRQTLSGIRFRGARTYKNRPADRVSARKAQQRLLR